MGCYDFFSGKCPSCGERFEVQTKLFDCMFTVLSIGSPVYGSPSNRNIALKDRCPHCKGLLIAVIRDGKLVKFVKDREGIIEWEGLFGAVYNHEPPTSEEQFNGIVKGIKGKREEK